MLDAYLEVLDDAYFEVKEAFDGLADENVWKRPADGLLSIGEIAGHVGYWQAVKFASDTKDAEMDVSQCHVKSLLIDPRFRYYPGVLAASPSPEQLAMTAAEVGSELQRIHTEAIAYFRTRNLDLDGSLPGYPANFTVRAIVRYAAIHVAYHVGQIYTVRHLLGETTPDN
ncbi:MAG TPA: DinB family protein [Capsulimonadaceae bacterium]|jgi:hypothetical protein